MVRRRFITITIAAVGGTLVYSLDRKASLLAQAKTVQMPLLFFDENEARIVTAAVSRIFPNNDLGPGATEIDVLRYIDRQLASAYGRDRYRYVQGPFFEEEALAELGYQGKASPREAYRAALAKLSGFNQLSLIAQDEELKKIETTYFFSLLRQHTIEGMFCDPMHGGNAGMLGWQMIGFPGPRDSYRADVDQHYGEEFHPPMVSLNGNDLVEEEK